MAPKRKHDGCNHQSKQRKRAKQSPLVPVQAQVETSRCREPASTSESDTITHPVLNRYYASVTTLRQYLLTRLPPSSKARRRILSHLGRAPKHEPSACSPGRAEDYETFTRWLDQHLVGVRELSGAQEQQARVRDLDSFSQRRLTQFNEASATACSTASPPSFSQSEVRRCLSLPPAQPSSALSDSVSTLSARQIG